MVLLFFKPVSISLPIRWALCALHINQYLTKIAIVVAYQISKKASWYPSTALMVSPALLNIPLTLIMPPHTTEHPPHYSEMPPHTTHDISPRYWTSPTLIPIPHTTAHTLYGVNIDIKSRMISHYGKLIFLIFSIAFNLKSRMLFICYLTYQGSLPSLVNDPRKERWIKHLKYYFLYYFNYYSIVPYSKFFSFFFQLYHIFPNELVSWCSVC